METESKKLLKKGITSLLPENTDIFKQNIIDALVFKIHENVDITKKLIGKELLFRETPTPQSPELLEFIEFVNSCVPGTYMFQNNSNINITESDISSLKQLFESLNPRNREKMVSDILKDGSVFKQHLAFSKKAHKLI
jgi:hypothetical protein